MALRTKTLQYAPDTINLVVCEATLLFDTAGTFTDESADISDDSTGDVTTVGAVGDVWYWSVRTQPTRKFEAIRVTISTAPSTGGMAWEYWNGAAWTGLTFILVTGNSNFTSATQLEVNWTIPVDWAQTSVNGTTAYWIRQRVTTAFNILPAFSTANLASVGAFTKTIHVPEVASRTFRSVTALVSFKYAFQYGGGSSIWQRATWRLGAAAATVADRTADVLAKEGAFAYTYDLTSHFVANFGSGSSELTFSFSSLLSTVEASPGIAKLDALSMRLFVTYEAEEQNIRAKTVLIPLESPNALLTTALTEIGTNQVPALDNFCPEAGKLFRDIFFLVEYQTGNISSTAVSLALDAEAADVQAAFTLPGYAPRVQLVWSRTDMATNVTHTFKARAGIASVRWLSVILVATYEYNHSASATVLNSVVLPLPTPAQQPLAAVAAPERAEVELWVEEPGPITLMQSGVFLNLLLPTPASESLSVRTGLGAYRTYAGTSTASLLGPYCAIKRGEVDWSLVRGRNRLRCDYYLSVASKGEGVSGFLVVNYTSAKAAAGDGAHNHTVWYSLGGTDAAPSPVDVTMAPVIAEASYFLSSAGVLSWITTGGLTDPLGLVVSAEVGATEFAAAGWIEAGGRAVKGAANTYAITSVVPSAFAISAVLDCYPGDGAPTLDVETSRKWRLSSSVNPLVPAAMLVLTYHSITFVISGTVSGYSGDGSAIAVELFRTDTGAKIGSTTTAVGGAYSFVWYDSTINVFGAARQDATHLGRSDNALAS